MTEVVIPVKDLSQAKGRLQNVLNRAERAQLVLAMLHDLLNALQSCRVGNIWLVAHDEAVHSLGTRFGARMVHEVQSRGYNHAVSTGLQTVDPEHSVVVLPADVPLARPEDIARLMALPIGPSVGIIPDRHNRGTNGLFLSSPHIIKPAFGPNSLFDHKIAAAKAGSAATIVPSHSMAMDIDCADDLFALAQSGVKCATTAFLNSIEISQKRADQHNWSVA